MNELFGKLCSLYPFQDDLLFYTRKKEARATKTPLTICPRTFTTVLDSLGYSGQITLACDDTKLLDALRLQYDHDLDCEVLIGGIDGPIRINDSADLKRVMNDPTIKKGTKVGLLSYHHYMKIV